MKYDVASKVFEMEPQLTIGIIIGKDIQNSETKDSDLERMRKAEAEAREKIELENLRGWPTIQFYRETMKKAGINPNRFPVSVEAMMKRVLKGGSFPVSNWLVTVVKRVHHFIWQWNPSKNWLRIDSEVHSSVLWWIEIIRWLNLKNDRNFQISSCIMIIHFLTGSPDHQWI